jgi:hypothetical protein
MNETHAIPGPSGRRARRGDGSALASFLCPVCFHDALVEDVACPHLLLVQDRHGDVFCRDGRVRTMVREAEAESGGRGSKAMERLCERLGPGVVLYELVEPCSPGVGTSSVYFVVDASDGASDRRVGAAG